MDSKRSVTPFVSSGALAALPEARRREPILMQQAAPLAKHAGSRSIHLFSTGTGAFYASLGLRQVPVAELVAAHPSAPEVFWYDKLGWLSTEVAWRLGLA